MKKVIVCLVVIAAGVVAFYYWRREKEPVREGVPVTTTARVLRGTIVSKVPTTGRVVANLDVEIKCKASGEVVRLPFDVSDRVKKAELLVSLDPVDEQRVVRQAEVSLSASQAKLAQARQNFLIARKSLATEKKRAEASLKSAEARASEARAKRNRQKELLEKKLTSQEEYDAAEAAEIQAAAELDNARIKQEELDIQALGLELERQDVKLAEAQVEMDRIALSNAQQRLSDTKVYAPIDGVISERKVQIGQIISSGISNVGGGTTVLWLSDLSRIFVIASVDESDIGRVKAGQRAGITTDAFPHIRLMGKVVRIATKGVNVSNVVTFEVKIEVLGEKKDLLKPEMTANVEIIAARKDDVLHVPVEAVFRAGGARKVLVRKGEDAPEERAVKVGISDGVRMEILSGLKEDETVIVRKGEAESRWRSDQRRRRRRPFF
jgi:multidrug efflux pump subunit AcrA (membrane-fusion protein)